MIHKATKSSLTALIVFCIGAAAAVAAGIFAGASVGGVLGVAIPAVFMSISSAVISAGLVVLSAYLLHRDGASLATLGLLNSRTRVCEFSVGFVVSAALFLAVASAQSAMVGASWQFRGMPGLIAALTGLVMAASMVLAEELLFRGVGLRYLRRLCGDWGAIVLAALLFGAYHLIGSGDWAMGAFFRFLTSALGGLLFGWAAVRSGGLALPIGLHLGGNWIQAGVAGFTTRPTETAHALWHIPISASDMQWLVAPDVLPRLPYLLAIGVASVAAWMIPRIRPAEAR